MVKLVYNGKEEVMVEDHKELIGTLCINLFDNLKYMDFNGLKNWMQEIINVLFDYAELVEDKKARRKANTFLRSIEKIKRHDSLIGLLTEMTMYSYELPLLQGFNYGISEKNDAGGTRIKKVFKQNAEKSSINDYIKFGGK